MKKVLSFTILFVLATFVAVLFRNSSKTAHEKTDALEKFKTEREGEHESDGPQEFIKFHQGIRTRSDEQRPGYPANYQWTELQKAQRFSAKKSNPSARTQSGGGGNGVI